jgi:hypothetical protein
LLHRHTPLPTLTAAAVHQPPPIRIVFVAFTGAVNTRNYLNSNPGQRLATEINGANTYTTPIKFRTQPNSNNSNTHQQQNTDTNSNTGAPAPPGWGQRGTAMAPAALSAGYLCSYFFLF